MKIRRENLDPWLGHEILGRSDEAQVSITNHQPPKNPMTPPNPPRKTSGLWARLFSVQEEEETSSTESLPAETPPAAEPVLESAPPELPMAKRVEPSPEPQFASGEPAALDIVKAVAEAQAAPIAEVAGEALAGEVGPTPAEAELASQVGETLAFTAPPVSPEPSPQPLAAEAVAEAILVEPSTEAPPAPQPPPPAEPAQAVEAPQVEICPICSAQRKSHALYCEDCGYMYTADSSSASAAAPTVGGGAESAGSGSILRNRYHISGQVDERLGVKRFRGLDLGDGGQEPQPVIIVAAELPAAASVKDDAAPAGTDDEILPTFEEPQAALPTAVAVTWPGVVWERFLIEEAKTRFLPRIIDNFAEGSCEYLVLEIPQGKILWDAWTEAENAASRYGLLIKLAQGLDAVHKAGAVTEGLHPDLIVVDEAGQPRLTDTGILLPLPVPADAPIRANLYTAPELVLTPSQADARADMYCMGAILYSLEYLGHSLEEKDFEKQFSPRLITDRFPDVHPAFNRLILKTFTCDLGLRFPTDEMAKKDPSGFTELIKTLEVCQRTFDNVRLDVAAWTTTGMVRTGNEDAFAFLHAVEARQDDLWEYVLVLLADGMGGYEAGEVAAAMAISSLRKYLLDHPLFSSLAGKDPPPEGTFNIDTCQQVIDQALRYANKEVYTFSRTPGKGKRGMGCTAEVVYIDNRHLVVGHVGDSRTYHVHKGRLIQLTRDQTWVQRMVELGKLTEEEAENHDRKNELQQAIGAQPEVRPGLYHSFLERNDWVLVCTDGLTNHIPSKDLEKMMTREAAGSAEEAARRFLNLVNLRGATDNSTVVAVRAA